MPNKTIYVSDSELPLFENVQEMYGTNLSSAIVGILRSHIKGEGKYNDDDAEANLHEIIVKVGRRSFP